MASHNTNKYKSNTIVMWRGTMRDTMRDTPAFVESKDNSNEAPDEWWYTLTVNQSVTARFPEVLLRPMTFDEFASFTHPLTGEWMVGKTRGWMAVVIHALSLLGIVAGIVETARGNIAALSVTGISTAVVALFWVMTRRNFKGTTV
jgi:hypothetical protein